MIMQKGHENRYQVTIVSIEDLVPQEHLLRQISSAVDFSKIHEFVKGLYCDNNGRLSVDKEATEAGYLRTEAVFIDRTHIKANVNTKKKIMEEE